MAFTAAQIEDGTGKTTAKVYFSVATATTWLADRGKTALSNEGTAATQEAAMLTAHEMCEDALLVAGFVGSQVTNGQGLLLPATGAYDFGGMLLDDDEIPAEAAERKGTQRYFEGLCLAAEKAYSGDLESVAATSGALGEIKSVSRRGHSVVMRDKPASFADRHPEIWRKIRAALPPPRVAWAV